MFYMKMTIRLDAIIISVMGGNRVNYLVSDLSQFLGLNKEGSVWNLGTSTDLECEIIFCF